MTLLTNALISEVATERGAWTRAQLGFLGVPWPPPKGWRKRLVAEGRVLTDEDVANLRGLRTVAAKKGNGAAAPENPHPPAMVPCPWCGAPVERITVAAHTRRFCPNTNHRNLYNSAIRRLAISQADLITVPGALQKWDSASCTIPGSAKWLSSLLGEG